MSCRPPTRPDLPRQAPPQVDGAGSGAILREVLAAADLLAQDWGIQAEVWSATSFSELDREARTIERWNRLNPDVEPRSSHVATCLTGRAAVIAATDYVRAYPGMIAAHLEARYTVLGTDGFGRSDTRTKLRQFFEVDRHHIVLAALTALAREQGCPRTLPGAAITRYGIASGSPPPWAI